MKILTVITSSLFFYLLIISNSYGQLCKNWGQPKTLGALDHKIIAEASGIAVSKLSKNRLYHVNDSGNGSYFYSTYMDGSNTKSISIKGFDSSKADFEDMTIGPCYLKTCLFIGDIGDNNKARDYIKILVIEEKENYKSNVKPTPFPRLTRPRSQTAAPSEPRRRASPEDLGRFFPSWPRAVAAPRGPTPDTSRPGIQ